MPVILTYVVGLVYSYGGMGRDFYTSNLCLNAVGKKTWEICDDYIAMEGGNYELDKIYSKGDSYSNIRFRVTDEQDKVEFSNVSDGDTFCYSTVYDDKTFDVYLVKGLPAQDDIYWAKVFYDKAENWGQNALEMLILFGAMELFLLIFLARTAARREDGELQGGWQEKIPFDLYLLVDGTIIALLCVAVEEVYSYVSFYTPPYDVLLLAMSFALAVLVFAAWVTFCARVKVGGLWKGTIVYKLLCLCWKIIRWGWKVLCGFCRGMRELSARHSARLAHGGGLLHRRCDDLPDGGPVLLQRRAAASRSCLSCPSPRASSRSSFESSRRRAKPSPPAILTRRWTQSGCIGTLSATPRT